MGSYASLRFDGSEVDTWKSFVPEIVLTLFQETDRSVVENEEDGLKDIVYTASRDTVLRRLDIMGVTSARARASYESWRDAEIASHKELVDEGEE